MPEFFAVFVMTKNNYTGNVSTELINVASSRQEANEMAEYFVDSSNYRGCFKGLRNDVEGIFHVAEDVRIVVAKRGIEMHNIF